MAANHIQIGSNNVLKVNVDSISVPMGAWKWKECKSCAGKLCTTHDDRCDKYIKQAIKVSKVEDHQVKIVWYDVAKSNVDLCIVPIRFVVWRYYKNVIDVMVNCVSDMVIDVECTAIDLLRTVFPDQTTIDKFVAMMKFMTLVWGQSSWRG